MGRERKRGEGETRRIFKDEREEFQGECLERDVSGKEGQQGMWQTASTVV